MLKKVTARSIFWLFALMAVAVALALVRRLAPDHRSKGFSYTALSPIRDTHCQHSSKRGRITERSAASCGLDPEEK